MSQKLQEVFGLTKEEVVALKRLVLTFLPIDVHIDTAIELSDDGEDTDMLVSAAKKIFGPNFSTDV